MLLSTFIYVLILLRLIILKPTWILEVNLIRYEIIKLIGFVLITIGFLIGMAALIAMKNSWRVGIKYDQKTKLVTSGIFRLSRNPYFLSYDILILGYILIFPSPILFIMYITLVIIFHKMISEEEKYLETVHGNSYLEYKNNVNRYFTLK